MDKLVIFEKVKSVVADILELDLSEVTFNTKIDNWKPHKPLLNKPSSGSSWGSSWLSSGSSGYFGSNEDLDKKLIIIEFEEEFDIKITDEEADKIIIV